MKELRQYGPLALPEIRRALKGAKSSEQQRRLEQLADELAWGAPSTEELCLQRSLAVLEWIGGHEAQRVLEKLLESAPEGVGAEEVKGSLGRVVGGGSRTATNTLQIRE